MAAAVGRDPRHQLLGGHVLVGEQLEDLLGSACHVAGSGEADHEGKDRVGEVGIGQPTAGPFDRAPRLVEVGVAVRRAERGERGVVAEHAQAFAQGPQAVDHARHPGVVAEEDQAPSPLVGHALVVDQGAALGDQLLQHGHVEALPLDRVREEHVGPALAEPAQGHLLDAEHDLGSADVVDQAGARLEEFLVPEGPAVEALGPHLDALRGETAHRVRGERHAALPGVLVLTAQADAVSGHGRGSPSERGAGQPSTLAQAGGARTSPPRGRARAAREPPQSTFSSASISTALPSESRR